MGGGTGHGTGGWAVGDTDTAPPWWACCQPSHLGEANPAPREAGPVAQGPTRRARPRAGGTRPRLPAALVEPMTRWDEAPRVVREGAESAPPRTAPPWWACCQPSHLGETNPAPREAGPVAQGPTRRARPRAGGTRPRLPAGLVELRERGLPAVPHARCRCSGWGGAAGVPAYLGAAVPLACRHSWAGRSRSRADIPERGGAAGVPTCPGGAVPLTCRHAWARPREGHAGVRGRPAHAGIPRQDSAADVPACLGGAPREGRAGVRGRCRRTPACLGAAEPLTCRHPWAERSRWRGGMPERGGAAGMPTYPGAAKPQACRHTRARRSRRHADMPGRGEAAGMPTCPGGAESLMCRHAWARPREGRDRHAWQVPAHAGLPGQDSAADVPACLGAPPRGACRRAWHVPAHAGLPERGGAAGVPTCLGGRSRWRGGMPGRAPTRGVTGVHGMCRRTPACLGGAEPMACRHASAGRSRWRGGMPRRGGAAGGAACLGAPREGWAGVRGMWRRAPTLAGVHRH